MLLTRNEKPGIEVVVIERENEGTCDPLSPKFIIPQWLRDKPTPWNLVAYFDLCLQELVIDGQARSLVEDYKRELRPAKKLLEENDLDTVARAVKLTASQTFGQVTMYRVADRVPQIKQARD